MEPSEIKDVADSLSNLQTFSHDEGCRNAAGEVELLTKKMRLVFVEQAIVEIMANHYDFGEVTSVTRLFGGLINQNFGVATNNGQRRYRFFIKRYNKDAKKKDIILEHKFNEYLCSHDFQEVAQCIKTKDGNSFVEYQVENWDSPDDPSIFAVYSYLDGEDRYAWRLPHCTKADLASASAMLAKLHDRGYGFDASEYLSEESKILPILEKLPTHFANFEKKARGSMQDNINSKYFLEKLPAYHQCLEKCQILKEKCQGMLELMIHRDYHPGNQKYSDKGVVGVFDFDWCIEDLRLFDIAITITYFCTSWKAHEDGVLFFDEIKVLLEAYQGKLKDSTQIFPLTKEELAILPEMILIANMYVIWWDLLEIFEVKESESDESDCLVYLTHNTKINDFALEHLEELRQVTQNIDM